jgi:NAD(P)-dependent dehydrogenase (short-subunit alcohol dehydrogenase family)
VPIKDAIQSTILLSGTVASVTETQEGAERLSTRLDGKVAVVTGAGQGLGRAIALRCAAEGAHVALAARSEELLTQVADVIEASGGRALAVRTDVRDPAQVAHLAEVVTSELGPADVLVNNSGIGGPTSVLWEMEPADWEETLRVNLTGTFLCCRAFLPAMVERGSGSVVVIGSVTGKRPLIGRTPYAASKLGLVGLVRTLAWEAGEHGIRVNLISPGPIDGERLDRVITAQAEVKGVSAEEAREQFASGSPLRRFVSPDDVAEAVVFLASDLAASVTGEDFNVSAGLAMY